MWAEYKVEGRTPEGGYEAEYVKAQAAGTAGYHEARKRAEKRWKKAGKAVRPTSVNCVG